MAYQTEVDFTVFDSFFEQYCFNSLASRKELEEMLRDCVSQETASLDDAGKQGAMLDCEALIVEARTRTMMQNNERIHR